jgi:hypothetical protein
MMWIRSDQMGRSEDLACMAELIYINCAKYAHHGGKFGVYMSQFQGRGEVL